MIYDQLVKLSLFQSIEDTTIHCLNEMGAITRTYQPGEIVSYFGDNLDYIYVIMRGTLKTNEYTVEGREIVSSYYSAYDAFPFYLMYSGVTQIPYNVICHKEADVILLPVDKIQECINQDMKFMQNVMVFISKYCNYNKKVIRTTSYSKVIQRLAFWILTSVDRENCYQLPGTQEVFADILQTNRSSLNQELQRLSHLGAIQLKGRTIKLLDRSKLEEILNDQTVK